MTNEFAPSSAARAPPSDSSSVEQGRAGTSLYGASIEYGLHCILWLVGEGVERASSRNLAELQGVPMATMAKIMPRLEKAGIVSSMDGIMGGYALARSPDEISVLDVVDAIEGGRRLFDCKEIRRGCVLFGGTPPDWSSAGLCGIHSLMLRAENRMRAELARTSLAKLARGVARPPEFDPLAASWIEDRSNSRRAARVAAVKQARQKSRQE